LRRPRSCASGTTNTCRIRSSPKRPLPDGNCRGRPGLNSTFRFSFRRHSITIVA
jgi:hypothetical protein